MSDINIKPICDGLSTTVNFEIISVTDAECAIIIGQVHYWLQVKEHNHEEYFYHDGKYWIYNSRANWEKMFPCFSKKTLERKISKLREMGILVTANWNKESWDKTLWYTIDYDRLNELICSKVKKTLRQNDAIDCPKLTQALRQNDANNTIEYIIDNHSKKTFKCLNGASSVNDDARVTQNPSGFTPKGVDAEGDAVRHVDGFDHSRNRRSIRSSGGSATNYKSLLASIRKSFERCCIPEYAREDIQKDIVYFYYMYYNALHEYHPNISASAMDAVVKALYDGTKVVCDYSHEIYAPMIDDYFDANMECDYHITHFISGNIRDMRWYETESEDYVPDRYFERLYSDMRP